MKPHLILLLALGCTANKSAVPPLDVKEVVCSDADLEQGCIRLLESLLFNMYERVVQVVVSEEADRTRRLRVLVTRSDDDRWVHGRDLYVDKLEEPIVDPSLVFTFRGEKMSTFVLRKYPASNARIDPAGWQPSAIPTQLQARKLEVDPRRQGVLYLTGSGSSWSCVMAFSIREGELTNDPIRPDTCRAISTSLGTLTKCTSERGWLFVFRDEWLLGIGLMYDPTIDSLLRDLERGRHCG